MRYSASKLRENIYKLLDKVLKTGKPIEIERKGKLLRVVPVEHPSKLSRLMRRNTMKVPPDELVHIDWSHEWRPKF